MNDLVVDSSVLVKWFWSTDEAEVAEAQAIQDAHVDDRVRVRLLDLAVYELGNVFARRHRLPAAAIADQLDDLRFFLGDPLRLSPVGLREAAALATRHGLTYYDAGWVAFARELASPLVSADRQLLDAGLAISAADAAALLPPRNDSPPNEPAQ